MRVIPVLDLRHGQAVHAVAGQREQYRGVQTNLSTDGTPVGLARALLQKTGRGPLYVADLDAIIDRQPQDKLWNQLATITPQLWLDAGMRDVTHARQLQELLDPSSLPRVHWIVALETLAQPAELERLVDALGPERLIFSLDQRGGRLLTAEASAWPDDAASIAALVVASGIRRMILLDLASVGRSAGVASLPLCRLLHTRYAAVELIAGGGVRDAQDLADLAAAGCSAALVATALHRGML